MIACSLALRSTNREDYTPLSGPHSLYMPAARMTRGEFDSRYQLLNCIADAEVRSYRARKLVTGQEIMVHLLAGIPDEQLAELRQRLRSLEPEDRAQVLEETEVDGESVVMTDLLPEFTSFPAWLESRVSAIAKPVSKKEAPSEFTMLFGTPAAEPVQRASPPPAVVQGASPPPVIRLGGAPPQQVPSQQVPSSGDHLFSGPSSAAGPLWPTPVRTPATSLRGPSVPVKGPGEIAELIARTVGQSATVPGVDSSGTMVGEPTADPQAPGGSRSYLPLIIILAALFLCAVGLVLYFTL
jgi:hypothetical protein